MKYLLLFFFLISFAQSQKFIPVDEETLEFIPEVNYTLHFKKLPVYKNSTSKDSVTRLPKNIVFDSISFFKLNYKETGLSKVNLDEVVLISKKVFELDEVVILNSKQKEAIIGEKSRFVKRHSANLTQTLDYGILFPNTEFTNKSINKLLFYVEKVKYRTAYKIKFFSVEEVGNPNRILSLQFKEMLFETPILLLEVGKKNKIEIDLDNYNLEFQNENIFVAFELENYFDTKGTVIHPPSENQTKLKFQMSNKVSYYSKTSDYYTKEMSKDLININGMINYDFANQFFKKPHKSILVAPAILFSTTIKK